MKSYILTVATFFMMLFSNGSVTAQCSKVCKPENCSSTKTSCCSKQKGEADIKILDLELLYLDLSVCGRCKSTDKVIEESIDEVKDVLAGMGYSINFIKTHIQREQCAKDHAFISSPTVRINNRDIVFETKESNCTSCGELCGTRVNCREWVWQGKSYTAPPKAMIIDAIFKSIYVKDFGIEVDFENYKVPQNLNTFFEAKNKS